MSRGSSHSYAVALFNESEAARTAAGLARTLGAPRVSVGAAAGAAGLVRITVAWDLTWYQWTVDLKCSDGAVAEVAKGKELAELDVSARHWNARLADGRVLLGLPRRRVVDPSRAALR